MINTLTKVERFKMFFENHPIWSIIIIIAIVIIGIKSLISSIEYLINKIKITNKFILKLVIFAFNYNIIKIPKPAISLLQLIGNAQNLIFRSSENPTEHYVIINMLTNYFEKDRTTIIYFTNILENKKYIKRQIEFNNIEQFALTEKGIRYLVEHKLINKKIKRF